MSENQTTSCVNLYDLLVFHRQSRASMSDGGPPEAVQSDKDSISIISTAENGNGNGSTPENNVSQSGANTSERPVVPDELLCRGHDGVLYRPAVIWRNTLSKKGQHPLPVALCHLQGKANALSEVHSLNLKYSGPLQEFQMDEIESCGYIFGSTTENHESRVGVRDFFSRRSAAAVVYYKDVDKRLMELWLIPQGTSHFSNEQRRFQLPVPLEPMRVLFLAQTRQQ